jgi:hypothetical protein
MGDSRGAAAHDLRGFGKAYRIGNMIVQPPAGPFGKAEVFDLYIFTGNNRVDLFKNPVGSLLTKG